MNKIARFEKVSSQQFAADVASFADGSAAYERIQLPRRATSGSAGYDVFSPFSFILKPGESIKIPSGIRCRIEDGWVLFIMPKSGLGTRYRLQLNNTIGVVDADYYYADNEGHIIISLTNDSKENKTLEVAEGKAIVQFVFLPFGITEDDEACGVRTGGFGSTGV